MGHKQVLENRANTITVILDEIMRLRSEQDDRLDHYRRVAGLLLGIFIPVSGLAALGIISREQVLERRFWDESRPPFLQRAQVVGTCGGF